MRPGRYPEVVRPYVIRRIGDPVLRRRAREVTELDGGLARTVGAMVATMLDADGGGLAAPQVGIGRRYFVYRTDDGPRVAINPEIVETAGACVFPEGCLSIPGLTFDLVRPERVTLRAVDLDGREVVVEADDYLGRMFQHEIDHLDGILAIDRLEPDERRRALRRLAEADLQVPGLPRP